MRITEQVFMVTVYRKTGRLEPDSLQELAEQADYYELHELDTRKLDVPSARRKLLELGFDEEDLDQLGVGKHSVSMNDPW